MSSWLHQVTCYSIAFVVAVAQFTSFRSHIFFSGPYQSIVESALTAGSVFRVLPLVIGGVFFLYQKRNQYLGFFRRIVLCIAQIPLFLWNAWKRCWSKPAASDEGLRAALYNSRATGDGSLLLGSLPQRRPRLSELADSYIVPRAGRDSSDAFEGSMAEMQGANSDKSSLLYFPPS